MPDAENAPEADPLTFELGPSRFEIAPEKGFRLMRWTVKAATGDREVLYWPETLAKGAFENIRGGNPILFPFAGRSFDRGVENFWQAPDGKRLPMPRHGFSKGGTYEIIRKTDTGIAARLVPKEADLEAYPFSYDFTAAYEFSELSLRVELNLENLGDRPIPWSAGHHFYFTLPWHKGASRHDYHLHMEAKKCAYHGPDGKLVMAQDRNSCHELAEAGLLDRIHWQLRHNRVSFGPKGGEEDVHLIIGDDPVPQKNYSLITWSETEEAPYYCIEPWMGPPNAAGHGKGLHWVGKGESQSFKVEVSLF